MRALQRYLDQAGYETDRGRRVRPATRRSVMPFEGRAAPRGRPRLTRRAAPASAAARRRGERPGTTEAREADVGDDGLAIAPAAPQEVKDVIAAGNEIAKKPYKYGGGHGRCDDSGYDCSGSVSYALRAAA